MSPLYERITRFFLRSMDPYTLSGKKPEMGAWAYMRSHVLPLRRVIIASLVFTSLAAAVEVWLIQYAGAIIDSLASTSRESFWSEHGLGLLSAVFVLVLLRPLAQFLRLAINDIAFNCNAASLVRWRAFDHLIRQSVGWFQEDLTGRTSGRLVDIGNHVADSIFSVLNALAFGLVYMVGVVVLMAGTEVWLALPLLLWLGLYFGVLFVVIPHMVKAQQGFQGAKSAMIGSVVDSFSNIDTLKLFAPKNQIADEFKDRLEDTRMALFKTRQIGVGLRTVLVLFEAVVMVGFVGYGIWLWSTGQATIGLVSAAIALSLRITTMADWIMDSMWWVFLRFGSLREALRTIAQPIAIPEDPNAPSLKVEAGEVSLKDVHHHYGLGHGGLNGLSLTINPGEKVGIVGRSGAGKSTLVNLILRFYKVEEGVIAIDGQDIQSVSEESLQRSIGMVPQQAALLNRSVEDNILLGQQGVSAESVQAATQKAMAHEFIQGLRDNKGRAGYQAHVGERGVKLSGGQRQRIALARVILKDAPILILDEATSALDSEVEAEIHQSLIDVMEDKTVIAIAHRLSTIARMDRIVVVDKGQVAEEGTHDELIAANGLYASFWRRQSDGFIDTTD